MASAAFTSSIASRSAFSKSEPRDVKIWGGPWSPKFGQEQEFPYTALTPSTRVKRHQDSHASHFCTPLNLEPVSVPRMALLQDLVLADVANDADSVHSLSDDEDFFCFTPCGLSSSSLDKSPLLVNPRSSSFKGPDYYKSLHSSAAEVSFPNCKLIAASELSDATNHWAKENILGVGGSGTVYKGKLRSADVLKKGKQEYTEVAVKRLHSDSWRCLREYSTEIEVLTSMQHDNIVKLLGHCPEEQALVFEYVGGGSLDQYLGASGKKLTWQQKMGVISGLGSALSELHSATPTIVHRDLKPANVLLSPDGSPKLADVGIARSLEEDWNVTYTVSGTIGYIDPQTMRTFEISPASDVYAFGLIVLQILLDVPHVAAIHRLLAELPANWSTSAAAFAASVKVIQERILAVSQEQGCGEALPQQAVTGLVYLALSCVRRSAAARPDMASCVIPQLAAIQKSLAGSAGRGASSSSSGGSIRQALGRATSVLRFLGPKASGRCNPGFFQVGRQKLVS